MMFERYRGLIDVLLSITGIYVCSLCQGVCQESIYRLTLNTSGAWGETQHAKFKYPIFLVSLVCTLSALMGLIVLSFEPKPSKVIPAFYELIGRRVFQPLDDGDAHHMTQTSSKLEAGGTELHPRPRSAPTNGDTTEKGCNQPTIANQAVLESKTRHELLRQGFFVSLSYVGAMIATNFALTRVNYPTQVLVKSAKAVPVVVGGYIFFRKTYHYSDYLTVVFVTLSLILFQLANILNPTKDAGSTWSGFIALLGALVFDGMTGPRQDKMVEMFNISVGDLMLIINVCSMPLAWTASALLEGTDPFTVLMNNMGQLMPRICLFLICGSLGQMFIVRILTSLGALHLTLITTTRKFLAILISVALYRHPLTGLQWFSIALLFGSGFLKFALKPSRPKHKAREVELKSSTDREILIADTPSTIAPNTHCKDK